MINVRGGAVFRIYHLAPLICNTDILFILRRFIMANVVSSFFVVLSAVLNSLGLVLPPDMKELLNLFWLAAERQPGKIPAMLLRGLPGAGKTSVAEAFALAAGAAKFFYQCTPGTGKDEMIGQPNLAAVLKNDAERAIADGVLIQAARAAINGDDVVLIIDEVDKASPETDAFLLDFLQSRRIRDTNNKMLVIPEDVKMWVFFTSNEERELSDALMRRVRRVTAERPDRELAAQILDINQDAALIDIYLACEKLAISQLEDYLSDGGDPDDINWSILSQYCEREDIQLNNLRDMLPPVEVEECQPPLTPTQLTLDVGDFLNIAILKKYRWEYETQFRVRVHLQKLSQLLELVDALKPNMVFRWEHRGENTPNPGLVLDGIEPILENKDGGIFAIGDVTVVAARHNNGEFYLPGDALDSERSDGYLLGALISLLPKWRENKFRTDQARNLAAAKQAAADGQAARLIERLGLDDLV